MFYFSFKSYLDGVVHHPYGKYDEKKQGNTIAYHYQGTKDLEMKNMEFMNVPRGLHKSTELYWEKVTWNK